MTTLLLTHPDSRAHRTPPGHPESHKRIEAVEDALAAPEFAALLREQPAKAPESEILRCHSQSYIKALREAVPAQGSVALDPDTHMSPHTLQAAFRSAGGAVRALDAVMAGAARNALSAMRPPGHHALAARPMGFCLFCNVAIAAKRALDHHGLARVAVADFDVHHGNGTQALLQDDPRVLFVSSHQMPLWPGSGKRSETGRHNNVLNLPLSPGAGSAEFRAIWRDEALPALHAHAPEILLVSAGFDAHWADPLAQLELMTDDFGWIIGELCDVAREHGRGRLVSVLEGGYDIPALVECVKGHVRILMERGK